MSETTTKQDGGPAFPVLGNGAENGTLRLLSGGMSLRDYLAAKAMQGLIQNPNAMTVYADKPTGFRTPALAADAYHMADAMLAARKAGGQ